MQSENLTASDRDRQQADVVTRLAADAESSAERDVYLALAEGWLMLADEALRHERRDTPRAEDGHRSFRHDP
ncbi:MAG: hypothetical protein KKE02_02485 [Alphaproteobacteria bacterium]|nr:hypothetical protein [Alphaproteobacteria bacterium]MBU1513455.1 hypothetical protein [Alphaproteobacteria bacterium]MBU2096447.1 hypothetical protein [Alphaproteobacteria bacterium]MBU2149861.1 hypothetical protein [Alphaproteobacteria bacterium]MBU2308233.1 hypothetical protein [Alphaproteobacteria bacterium]